MARMNITTKGLDISQKLHGVDYEKNPFNHTLIYDDGCDSEKFIDENEESDVWEKFEDKWETPGAAAATGAELGLPFKIQGNPLGCGCNEATLHGISKVTKGHVECDYMCDAGWHNWVVMRVTQQKQSKKKQVKRDKFGKIMQDEGYKATELEEL